MAERVGEEAVIYTVLILSLLEKRGKKMCNSVVVHANDIF